VWLKSRLSNNYHELYDIIRGAGNVLYSNINAAAEPADGLTSFTSDGFNLGDYDPTNALNGSYIAWAWDAGSSNAPNNSGTIASTVRANTTAGFSVVTWTGNGSNATVGHGLGVAPELVIVKSRSNANDWAVYHKYNTSAPQTDYLLLNSDAATADDNTYWNDTAPTSSVFSIGTNTDVNTNAYTYVAYCWTPVAGYSAFGSYTGNGSSDGPFVYTGFKPRWIMIKRSDSSERNWCVYDTARNTYNLTTQILYANFSYNEATGVNSVLDILSNGFKIKGPGGSELNDSAGTHIWAAYAEAPFPYARAR